MFSSNEIQTKPGETSTSQANPPVQPTPETSTNPNTTNNNGNNNEVNKKKNGDNNTTSNDNNTAIITPNTGDKKVVNEHDKCFKFWDLLPKKWCTNRADSDQESGDGSNSNKKDNSERMQHRLTKLKKKVKQIDDYVDQLEKFAKSEGYNDLKSQLQNLESEITEKKEASPSTKTTDRRIAEINKDIMKITKHLSSPETMSKVSLSAHSRPGTASNGSSAVHESVNVCQSETFRSSSFYKEIEGIFAVLGNEKRFFLSCFTVFPENAVVKRRIFVYWGVGEGILEDEEESPEEIIDEILREFQEKGLIEPATKKRKPQVKSYKMLPLVRSAVILISKKQYFDYDDNGNVLPQRYGISQSADSKEDSVKAVKVSFPQNVRMCLLKVEEQELSTQKDNHMATSGSNSEGTDPENLVTLFNVNEPFPDLELAWLMKKKYEKEWETKEPSAVDWLSKMKNAKVVCLGSWPGSVKSHIEVESTEFFEGLTNSKDLRFLSLQGVSRIIELPKSIGNHSKLMILDLKECHNLELLSNNIAKLTNLRYLDLSDCYLLAHMPKGLSALVKLRVLKGFVISIPQRNGSGTLHDLERLKKLRKLTINASRKDFPADDDLSALQQIGEELRKLTIAWGATVADKKGEAQSGDARRWKIFKSAPKQATKQHNPETLVTEKLPKQLEKLDLQCFPNSTATWLTPESLPKLKKLYIRGGNLATLGESKWPEVKTLRLKYLNELKMTWIKLQESFPKLEYLEKVKCPGITLCPCDQHGVWMKKKNPDQIEQK